MNRTTRASSSSSSSSLSSASGPAPSSSCPPPPQDVLAGHLFDCLYGDLDEATESLDLETLARQVQEGRAKVDALKADLERAQSEHRTQSEIHERTIRHLESQAELAVQSHASLLLTARAELNRKNDRIRELTDTLDRFMLKKCERFGLLDEMKRLLRDYYAQLIPERDCITLSVPDSIACVSHDPRNRRRQGQKPGVQEESAYQTEVKLQRTGNYNVISMGSHSIAWHIEGCRPLKPPKTLRLKSRPVVSPTSADNPPPQKAPPSPDPTLKEPVIPKVKEAHPKSSQAPELDTRNEGRDGSLVNAISSASESSHVLKDQRRLQNYKMNEGKRPSDKLSRANNAPKTTDKKPLNPLIAPKSAPPAPVSPIQSGLRDPKRECLSPKSALADNIQCLPQSIQCPVDSSRTKIENEKQKSRASPPPVNPPVGISDKDAKVPSKSISSKSDLSKKSRQVSVQNIPPNVSQIPSEKKKSSEQAQSSKDESDSFNSGLEPENIRSTRLSSKKHSHSGSASSSSSRPSSASKISDIDSKAAKEPPNEKSESLPKTWASKPKIEIKSQVPSETIAKQDDKIPSPEDLEDGEITSSDEDQGKAKDKSVPSRSQKSSSRDRAIKPISTSLSRSQRYKETLDKSSSSSSSSSRKRAHSPRSNSSSSSAAKIRDSRRSERSPKRWKHDHQHSSSSSQRNSRESNSRTKHKSSYSENESREHKDLYKDTKVKERPRRAVISKSSDSKAPPTEKTGDSQVEQQHIRSSTTMTTTNNRITSQEGTAESLSSSKTLTKVVDRDVIRQENKSVGGASSPGQLDEKLASQRPSSQTSTTIPVSKPFSQQSRQVQRTNNVGSDGKATNTRVSSQTSDRLNKPESGNEAPTETGLKITLPLSTVRRSSSSMSTSKSSSIEVKKPAEKKQLSHYLFGESDTESQDIPVQKESLEVGTESKKKSEDGKERVEVDVADMNTVDIDTLIEEKTSQFQSLAEKANHIYQRLLTSKSENDESQEGSTSKVPINGTMMNSPEKQVSPSTSFSLAPEPRCSSPLSEAEASYNPVSSPSRIRDSVPPPTYGSNRKRRITEDKIDFTSPVGVASLLKEVTEGAHLGLGNVIMTPNSGRSRSSSISSNTGVAPSGTTPKSSRSSPAQSRNQGRGCKTPMQGSVLFPESRDNPSTDSTRPSTTDLVPQENEKPSKKTEEARDPALTMDDNANMGHEDALQKAETLKEPPKPAPEVMVSLLKKDLDLSDASRDLTNSLSPLETAAAVVSPSSSKMNKQPSKDKIDVVPLAQTSPTPSKPTESNPTENSGSDEPRRKKKRSKQEKAERKKEKKAAKKEQKRLRKIAKKVNKRLKKEKSRNSFVIKSKADQICIYSHD